MLADLGQEDTKSLVVMMFFWGDLVGQVPNAQTSESCLHLVRALPSGYKEERQLLILSDYPNKCNAGANPHRPAFEPSSRSFVQQLCDTFTTTYERPDCASDCAQEGVYCIHCLHRASC
jgi:hypothetical protein